MRRRGALRMHGARGFTLLELAVVMLLLVIVLGMIGLRYGSDDDTVVQSEADRLALLLRTAEDEAILNGRVLALAVNDDGYRFYRLGNDDKFQQLTEGVLRERRLPPGMSIQYSGRKQSKTAEVVLLPDGELGEFMLELARGKSRWQVRGKANGEITSEPAA